MLEELSSKEKKNEGYRWRYFSVLTVLVVLGGILVWRMIDLTVHDRKFLEKQGNARSLRTVDIPAYRGMITDRFGAPLAVSTPVEAVWMNPKEADAADKRLPELAQSLGIPVSRIKARINEKNKEFIYLKRGLEPMQTEKIKAMGIPGIHFQSEFKRYYPDGEVTAQIVGFTNIDDQGQEGLELAYNGWLKGEAGKKRVLKDRLGHVIADVQRLKEPKPGRNLTLSIDRSIQYIAYRELKKTVSELKARSGSVVVLDAKTGEILAMVNQPSFNPNNRVEISPARIRNRALTDMFEPGSVMKAFSIASGLDSQKYQPDTLIDTTPGKIHVGSHLISDDHPAGVITVTQVLQKSSNVGVSKMTLSLPPEQLVGLLRRVGFGDRTNSGFPGESPGFLPVRKVWSPFVLSTLAFGYGLSVSTLQLAQAYSVFANHGELIPVSLLLTRQKSAAQRVMDPEVADEMLLMLESVVEGGTGSQAKVKGYRVAGKTGTARIAGKGGYAKDRHTATFAGIAPVSAPRLVVVVVIDDPKIGGLYYYAGTAAAPTFSRIMAASLRLLDVPPDKVEEIQEETHAKQLH